MHGTGGAPSPSPSLPQSATHAGHDEAARLAQRRHRLSMLGSLASLVIFVASIVVLWKIARDIDPGELAAAFRAASFRQIAVALALTGVSYLLLTGYDFLALRQLGQHVPYRTTALASFTSYAVSFTLGFPLLTAATVRYWIYAPKGLRASKVASLTVIAGITFWLGMVVVLAWSLLWEAHAVAAIVHTRGLINQALGVAGFALVIGYFVWVSAKQRAVTIQGWRLELPGPGVSLGQLVLGAGDVCVAAAVLYVLLPGGHGMSYEAFLAIYVFANMIGMASHSPGGLGVFEATVLVALSTLPSESVLGTLLLFRLCYYIGPFVLALALLGAYEIVKRLNAARRTMVRGDDPDL